MLHAGADTPEILALHLGLLGVDFEVHEPPELIEALRSLADRCTRAATAGDERPHPAGTGSAS